jgi:hypothetical protein
MSETTEKLVCFNDEAMLLAWGDSSTRGRTVTFLLSDDGDEHPFRHFTIKSGKRAGQRFRMVLVQVDDDERPVEKKPSQIAFLLCQDQQFWHFLNERSFTVIDSEAQAREYVLEGCGITSRSQLDTMPAARAAWEAVFYRPFCKYRDSLGVGL